jgi:hypothetical protein
MIVLPIISQVKYIINNDSLVCYTNIENRSIALLFIKGEKDSSLLKECNQYTNNLKLSFISLNNEFNHLDTITKKCINDNTNLNKELIKQDSKLKNKNLIIISSISINIVLLLILL